MRRALPVLLLCAGCATRSPVFSIPDPHDHAQAVHQEKASPFHVKDLKSADPVRVPLLRSVADTTIANPTNTLAAAIGLTHHQFYGYAVPVFLLLRNDRPYKAFVSHTWPNRAMGGIAWLDNRLVCFDLLAGEHIGWHYVIDAEKARVVFAAPYADQ